jgi:outer membrane protein
MRNAQRNEARALARAASADLQSTRQQLDEQLHAAWLRLTTAEARRKALARAASSAAMRLDATRIGLEAGDRTTLDVLTAESDQLRLDAERQRAALDLLLADLNLRALTGTLSPETLEHFDDWLTPSIAAH